MTATAQARKTTRRDADLFSFPVVKTDGAGTRSPAGIGRDVDSAVVWVEF